MNLTNINYLMLLFIMVKTCDRFADDEVHFLKVICIFSHLLAFYMEVNVGLSIKCTCQLNFSRFCKMEETSMQNNSCNGEGENFYGRTDC